MPSFDADRIRQQAGEIQNALRKLTSASEAGESAFLESPATIDAAKYNLIVAIEGAIDICHHIAARSGGRAPRDYGDCFVVLGEIGVVPPELVERLKRMAKFRNLLVHFYWKTDDTKVFRVIREDLGDIRIFLELVARLV